MPVPTVAQDPGVKIAAGDAGIGFGDVPRLDGLRFNFRDRALERLRGVNVTLWQQHEESRGAVYGLALGLPTTGAWDLHGIGVGAGVSAGQDLSGLALGGLGVGVGGEARGLLLGGIGAAASGVAIGGLGVGIGSGRGLVIAPGYFKVDEDGTFRGLSVSAYNDVRGTQRGVAIGILNIASELHGWQIGLINIARNKGSFSVLPLMNHHP